LTAASLIAQLVHRVSKKLIRNRWDTVGRWEPLLSQEKLQKEIVADSEVRWLSRDLERVASQARRAQVL